MTAREQAIEAAAKAICDESIHCDHTDDVDGDECRVLARWALAAALPVLLNDLADRIEREKHSGWVGDETLNDGINKAIRLVRAAAEGWGQ